MLDLWSRLPAEFGWASDALGPSDVDTGRSLQPQPAADEAAETWPQDSLDVLGGLELELRHMGVAQK